MDQNLEARLDDIERKLDRLCGISEGFTKAYEEAQAKQHELNQEERMMLVGSSKEPGLLIRVDRLEQTNERQKWLWRAVVSAVVTLIVGAVFAILNG